jgi:hypothetical protein
VLTKRSYLLGENVRIRAHHIMLATKNAEPLFEQPSQCCIRPYAFPGGGHIDDVQEGVANEDLPVRQNVPALMATHTVCERMKY